MTRSPLAPAAFPDLPEVAGVRFASAAAGLRYKGRPDVMLAVMAPGTSVAAAFTRSATRAACVLDGEGKRGGDPSEGAAFFCNAGNANAFTGKRGDGSVAAICAAVAEATGVPATRVFTASTGVIGQPLDDAAVTGAIRALSEDLSPAGIRGAADAILTTDTFPKGAAATVETAEGPVAVAGIAKGSGMIAPDMATMLAFVFTDADVGQDALQGMVARQVARTFNRATVDGDTSTSDAVFVAATRAGPVPEPDAFEAALGAVMGDLARQIVRDGEGATRFVTVRVAGAADDADAARAARAIAESPLVKTAIAGGDPNWGRIVMAVGKSGARADRDRLAIRFGDVDVAREGWVSPDYSEERAAAHMAGPEIDIAVDLGIGNGAAEMWTCDLTPRYIEINADYRS